MSSKFAIGKRNVQAAISLLESLGAVQIKSERGKHHMITGIYRGKKVRTVLSASPGDQRGYLNNICQIKRQLRAIDAAE